MFICPIYYHNWRNISTIYVHNNTSIKRNILTIKKIHREVGRAKDLPTPWYRPVTLCNIQSNVPVFMCVIRPWIRRKTNLNVFSFLVCAVWKKCFFLIISFLAYYPWWLCLLRVYVRKQWIISLNTYLIFGSNVWTYEYTCTYCVRTVFVT